MKNLAKNIAWALLILLAVSFFFSYLWSGPVAKSENIGLNDVVVKIQNNEVSKITVSGNNLTLLTKDDKTFKSLKEADSSLTETLKNYGVTPEQLAGLTIEMKEESSWGFWLGILLQTFLPFILIALFFWFIMRQSQKGANQAFSFGKVRLKLSVPNKEKVTFQDVAGLNEAKEELKEIVEFLKNPKKFLGMGARIPRGVLLMGPPGSGKTLLARAVSGEANVPFFHMSGAEFVEMFVGVGAARVRDVFDTAKKAAPSILFIDEIDAVGRERGAGMGGGHDEREQTLNQILVEMDGFERDTNVIVMAATNRPDILDAALLRPGRFDRRIFLDLPDIGEREAILKIHSRQKPLAKEVNFRRIAERTPGFSGADLANLMNEAAILSARRNKTQVTQAELFESIEKVILGPERKSRMISEKEKKIIAYHEAGHALVTYYLPEADPVQKVSVISRGQAGGYTLKVPLEDRRLHGRKQFLAEIAVLLAGFISEKIVLGDISTGASNDLKEASALTRKLVTQFGMSDKLGPITYGKTEEMIFLGREMTTEKNYSEKMAMEIDTEVKKIIIAAEKTADKIIKVNRQKLDLLAETLIKDEIIEKEEFEKLMKA
ncbi:MAG TPA: ATP-dependent zinc metalloprotease FtsH [Candidatus Paceibacterota bacterium]|nr:ATP-dependent zinc metalloprotease FtsH [Candidatus Paceibacterota bacterium]